MAEVRLEVRGPVTSCPEQKTRLQPTAGGCAHGFMD